MVQPGWYPDPDPAAPPGRLRWWTGTQWGGTNEQPQNGPAQGGPTVPASGTPSPQRGRRRGPLLIALVTLLLVALLGGLWWRHSRSQSASEDTDTTAPTVSSWNESSTPAPSGSGARPDGASSAAQTSASHTTSGSMACPHPAQLRATHPSDGRLHGGGLVSDVPLGYTPVQPTMGWFATDRDLATAHDANGWSSFVMLGAIDRTRFGSLSAAATGVIACHLTSANFPAATTYTAVLANEATTLQGHPAWHLHETVNASAVPGGGADYEVEVVDLGTERYGICFAGATMAAGEVSWPTLTVGP